jgi:prepilin-type N-terminal cleavage/methylation domain-containing protein
MTCRRGFTLIELLVGTAVFIIGFVAVYGLYLAAVRFRQISETTAQASLAASSLISEIQIDAGVEATTPNPTAGLSVPREPIDYVGDGHATNGKETLAGGTKPDEIKTFDDSDTDSVDEVLFPYRPQPGIFYRVVSSTDLSIDPLNCNDPDTTALRITLLVMPWNSPETSITFADIARQRRFPSSLNTATLIKDELLNRGLARQYDAVILRKPSWMR